MKKEKFDIVGVILTFLLACITFFSYMYNQMIYDSGLHAQIYSLFEEVGITEGRENIFLYMIFFVCLIVLLLIGFLLIK